MGGADLAGLIISLIFTVVILGVSLLVPLLTMGGIAGMMWFVMKQAGASAAAERQLLENGIAAPATITSVNQTGMYMNNNPQVRIDLEIAPPDGEVYPVVMHRFLQLVQIPQVQPGKVVDVRIDPENPKRVAIVGL